MKSIQKHEVSSDKAEEMQFLKSANNLLMVFFGKIFDKYDERKYLDK